MNRLSGIAIAALLIPCSLVCQPGTTPVPSKWLRDGRLVVPELNFSIASPTADAQWTYKDDMPKVDGNGSTAFLVDAGNGSKYVVTVIENSTRMTSTDGEPFFAGMRKTFPKDWQLRGTRFEVSDIPLRDSRKFKVTVGLPNGSSYYIYGYIVSGNRSYQTIAFSPSPDEPVRFTQFVRSFILLNPIANSPFPNVSGIFLLWAIWGAVANRRYVKRGGLRATRSGKLGLLAASAVGLAALVLLATRGFPSYYLGSITATVATLIFSLWELARWRVRRKHPLPALALQAAAPQEGIVYTSSELEAMKNHDQAGRSNL